MPIPFWDDAPAAWDTLSLGGLTMPGLASISGRVARKMDTRSRAGADGATVRDRGYEPAQLEIHVKVWTREQLAELEEAIRLLHPRGVTQPVASSNLARARRDLEHERQRQTAAIAVQGLAAENKAEIERLEARVATEESRPAPRAQRTPVDIAHPATALLGIARVYVTAISLPELRGGEFITTISAIEWTEAPRAAPPPATSSAGSTFADGSDAFSRNQARQRPTAGPPTRIQGPGSS